MGKGSPYLKPDVLNGELVEVLNELNTIAENRGQTLSQMALAWVLRDKTVASVLIGASRPEQIVENVDAVGAIFTKDELTTIEGLLDRVSL
jgi:L-glyceraldehyde 3-phosphate reductase